MRQDLLALTLDDLITLSNRGIVKRAQKELAKFTLELAETADGTVTTRWSDGVECLLPPNKTVGEAHCTCAATGICRHLVRTVLAYQQVTAEAGDHQETQVQLSAPWDPGQITDESLVAHFRKATLTRLRKQFEEGHVIELVRSSKPTARFHTLSLTVRFLVPDDVRYTHCDCDEKAPCKHVPLAVWAFRQLPAGQTGGIVTTRQIVWPVPDELLDELERSLCDLAEAGLAGAAQALIDRFRQLEATCRAEGLIWPAETVADLVQEYERYANHDARFSPIHVAELIGELCIRSEAVRSNTGTVPQLFIRGTEKDRETRVGTARLVGLGCGVKIGRGGVTLSAYLQDTDSGVVVAVRRDFTDPTDEEALPFPQLARRIVMKGISLASLGAKQLLIKGGKRLASHQFIPGRANAVANPQAYQWESLRAPTLAADFAEIRARLRAQPPLCLRPRWVAENLYVCPVAGVEAAHFAVAEQEVQAILRDEAGEQALLRHPYTSRGREGAERLLTWLTQHPEWLCFVVGRVRLGTQSGGLLFEPLSFVFQEGATRTMLQPWVDRADEMQTHIPATQNSRAAVTSEPIFDYPRQVMAALGELFLTGLHRANHQTVRFWQALHQHGTELGFVHYLDPMTRLIDSLQQKSSTLHWDWQPAAESTLEISLLTRLALEELSSGAGEP